MDKPVHHTSPRNILERGVAHIPEDRQKHGLILTFPVQDNLVLCTYYQPPFAKGLALQQKIILETAGKLVHQYDVRTPNVFVPVSTLSGGNQQKVIVAREFSWPIHLLIASQPTADWMSVRLNISTAVLSKNGMKEQPCCWFPLNWMKSLPCLTVSP